MSELKRKDPNNTLLMAVRAAGFKIEEESLELILRLKDLSDEKQFGISLYDINNAIFEAKTIINGPDK